MQKTLPDARIQGYELATQPPITLGLINADYQTGPLPAEVMQAVIADPAYWAFCWGSGLALARFVLEHSHWVRGKRVLDLGCGSGVVAIAAALAGAEHVRAADTDDNALAACAANANANHVNITLFNHLSCVPKDNDLLLMADVLYDKSNLGLLDLALDWASQVLVADSRIQHLPHPAFIELTSVAATTVPNLGEFDEFRDVRLFTLA